MLQNLYKMPLLNFVKHSIVLVCVTILMSGIVTGKVYADTNNVFTVVIDPGHGGKDPGAIGSKSQEKDIVLKIGLLTGKYISEGLDSVRVIYTRTTDEYIELYRRAEIANENKADLFISVHVNAVANKNNKVSGTSTHVLGLHRANESFEVAKRENGVILLEDDYSTRYEGFDPNSEESYIIFSFMANFYDNQSVMLAKHMSDQFRDRARRRDRGVKRQGLLVLAQTSMPGVLIETGFITNETEEKYLNSNYGQEIIASAIYRAVKDYIIYLKSIEKGVSPEELPLEEPVIVEENTLPSNEATLTVDIELEKETVAEPFNKSEKESISKENAFFKIQVLVSKNPINIGDDVFRDFNDVEEFYENGRYKYAVGYGLSYEEIQVYSKMVKNRFPDSFIVGVEEGKIVSAKSIIRKKESGN